MNGATVWARETINSDVFFYKPDKWFKIWFYIVNRVNFKYSKLFLRGEMLITYDEIMRCTKASKSQVEKCIKWMEKEDMLGSKRTTRGRVRIVRNYGKYQNLDFYKEELKKTTEKSSRRVAEELEHVPIRKNGNNGKNEKNNTELKEFLDLFNSLFNSKYTITAGRTKKLSLRLKTYTFEQIKKSLENLSTSEWHQGKNDRNWKADPDFLLRSDEQVDKWLNFETTKVAKKKDVFFLKSELDEMSPLERNKAIKAMKGTAYEVV